MAWQSFGTEQRGTTRTMGLLYIILILLLNDDVHSAFEVTKSQIPLLWERALHHCHQIRSNLTFAVPVVDLTSMTVVDKIDLQGEAWVGYSQIYEHFLFIVCVPLSEIVSSVSATFNIGRLNNRPGMCYSLCGLQGYIGLQGDLCYCIETRTFSTRDVRSVNSICENPLHCVQTQMLCGNLGYIKISVYKKVSISSNDIRGDGTGCVIVRNMKEYEMSVANCTGSFPYLCEAYTGQTLHLEESPTPDQWVYSIRHCGKTGKKSTTFIGNGTNFVFPNSSQSWWTSVVRDLVIQNYSESTRIQGTPLYEGFLKNSKEGIKLEFVHAGRFSRKMFVACMSDQHSTEKKHRTNEPAETPIISATSEAPTTPRIPDQHSTEKKYRTNEPAETPIISATSEAPTTPRIPVSTVILPVGLAALTSIAVVTLIVVCWRRRKEKTTKNEEASKLKYAETVAPLISETQKIYYEHEKETLNQLKENDQSNVSSVYDSLKEYNASFSAATGNLYDTSNFNIGDGTYAVTFSANTLRQVAQANCYDHVRMKKTNNGKYDHVELQDQRNSVNDIGTYDQVNALALDSTYYDTFQEKFKLHQQLEGNVYNTANFHPTK